MTAENNVSTLVRSFYSEHPFPWFPADKFNLKEDLIRLSSDYAKMIYMNMPYGKSVLDLGCGTGQFSCFLSLKASRVLGIDFSDASIARANGLKQKLGLKNITFENRDILKDLGKIQEKFDYIFCNGVLHHLDKPKEGFLNLSRLLKPGSFIIVGIYNKFGRISFRMQRKRKAQSIGRYLHKGYFEGKELNWELDQYCHPHEVSFSFGDIMDWFNEHNIRYCSSAPSIEHFNSHRLNTRPFSPAPRRFKFHGRIKNFLVQLSWMWSLSDSGGYSVIIGRKES